MNFFERKKVDAAEPYVKAIAASFLEKNKLSFLGFDRVYRDGSAIRLSTCTAVLEQLHSSQCVITVPIQKNLLEKDEVTYLVPEKDFELNPTWNEFKKRFQIGHLVDFLERNSEYYDQFWFFSSLHNDLAANLYFNSGSSFKEFFSYFKDQTARIMDDLQKERIILPQGMRPDKTSLWSDSKPRDFVCFTKREKQYLPYILKGCTAKEIALELNISPRTSQHYLDNIRTKLGCFRKTDLIQRILELKLLDPTLL